MRLTRDGGPAETERNGGSPRVLRTRHLLATLLVSLITAGCTGPVVCPAENRPAIQMEVNHAETGEPVEEALAIARDGAFVDSALTRSTGEAELVLNRPQETSYDVTVEKDAFETWTRSDVHVSIDEQCLQVNSAELEVDLVPQ